MQSVEKCKECAKGEDCYFRDVKDDTTGNVVSKVVCAKSDPCDPTICDNQRCTTIECGDQPPFGQCKPYGRHIDPCWTKVCQPGERCLVRAALCKTGPSSVNMKEEAGCFPVEECYCNVMRERCELRKTDTGYQGFCAKKPSRKH